MGFKARASEDVTIYHNPHCSTSVFAVDTARDNGVAFTEVRYLKEKPTRELLEQLVAKLEDPVEDLVRKDSYFKKLELDADAFVGKPAEVVNVLEQHPRLLQRPLIVRGDKAIIGRPKDRVLPFMRG